MVEEIQTDTLLSYRDAADLHEVAIGTIYAWSAKARRRGYPFRVRKHGAKTISKRLLEEFVRADATKPVAAFGGTEITAGEAARIMGTSEPYLRKLAREGSIPDTLYRITPGGYRRFIRKEVETYANQWDERAKFDAKLQRLEREV